MPLYSYSARDEKGVLLNAQIEAASEAAAVAMLHNRGLIVVKITDARMLAGTRVNKKRHKRITLQDTLFFVQQTSILLDAGITLIRALEIIADQVASSKLHQILSNVTEDIKAGQTFSRALSKYPQHFPAYWEFVIEAGESSGNLSTVLAQVAKGIASDIRLRTKIISALVYPAILLVASIGAILFFIFKIIPTFEGFYGSFGAKLPAFTLMVIQATKFFRQYFLIFVGGLIVFSFFMVRYARTKAGKVQIDTLILRLPVIGYATHDIILTRVNLILTMLLRSGINLLKTLEIVASASGNKVYEKALLNAELQIQKGKSLYDALALDPLFPTMMNQLILVGEESGRLPEMVEKVADYYESRVDVFIARLSVLIEPVIIVIVGVIVGILVVAMYLPIFSMATLVRH